MKKNNKSPNSENKNSQNTSRREFLRKAAMAGLTLAPVRDEVVIATKFGFQFENGRPTGRNSKPEHIRQVVD